MTYIFHAFSDDTVSGHYDCHNMDKTMVAIFGIPGTRRMEAHSELIQNQTFDFFAPPLLITVEDVITDLPKLTSSWLSYSGTEV